jgi:tetratricopeptide (TPR) repeat protein
VHTIYDLDFAQSIKHVTNKTVRTVEADLVTARSLQAGPLAEINLGRLYYAGGKPERALEIFEQNLSERAYQTHLALGFAYERLGDHNGAILMWKKYPRLYQQYFVAIGDVALGQNKDNYAVKNYSVALEVQPHVDVHLRLGEAYRRLGEDESAEEAFSTALESTSREDTRAFLFRATRTIDTKFIWSYIFIARTFEKQGNWQQAEYWYLAATRDYGAQYTYRNLGVFYYQLGDIEAALTAMQEAVQRGPDVPHNRFWLSRYYCEVGQLQMAQEEARKAVQLASSSDKFSDWLHQLEEQGADMCMNSASSDKD